MLQEKPASSGKQSNAHQTFAEPCKQNRIEVIAFLDEERAEDFDDRLDTRRGQGRKMSPARIMADRRYLTSGREHDK